MSKQSWLFPCNTIQPLCSSSLVIPQAFVFPRRPHDKAAIETFQGRVQGRLVIATIVVDPTLDDRIEHPSQILQLLVAPQRPVPASQGFPDDLGSLVANRRREVNEVFSPAVL
ncbi:MAG: hypothetical protein Q7U64_02800 [Desulfocapsaceae bacterium]|nr:hypothetical protein [Desulfocapsaceae bacterium]